jgi:capsular exopolysaccharide synthesis family protein
MSRIHEALKKAEQERSASLVDRKAEEPAELLDSRQVVKIGSEAKIVLAPAVLPDSSTAKDSKILQLDELRAKCVKTVWNPDPNFLVFSSSKEFPAGAEQFRTLRSRLYRIRESKPLSILLVSSATPGEGKTFVSANLAQALVRQRGCRVLLIDSDMRAPKLHQLLGAPPGPGLAEYLQGGIGELDILQKGQEDDLYFVQAGQHVTHPSELISNGRLKQLLDRVSGLFDWIIVDSPPILPVSDAAVLATMCQGVLFVVRAGITPAAVSQKACQQLQDANIVGVVLNSADDSAGSGSYYQYSGYGLGQSSYSQK